MPVVEANNLSLTYDEYGATDDSTVLIIMGFATQMIGWDARFAAQLAAQGFRVIRFDNRDVGCSTHLNAAGTPDVAALSNALKHGQSPTAVPYTLIDMAEDTLGLLNALDIPQAHIIGVSMGGMIGQWLAHRHPARVRSLTSMMSTTSDPSLPPSTPEARRALLRRPAGDHDGFVRDTVMTARAMASPHAPFDEAFARDQASRAFKRAFNPEGVIRQYAAVMASPPRTPWLNAINTPALVLHGADDPVVPLAHAEATAAALPNAELRVIEHMGHELSPRLWPALVDTLTTFLTRL